MVAAWNIVFPVSSFNNDRSADDLDSMVKVGIDFDSAEFYISDILYIKYVAESCTAAIIDSLATAALVQRLHWDIGNLGTSLSDETACLERL